VNTRTIRVATWNVQGMRAGAYAVASAVREHEVDVLLLQESGSRRRLRELGALGWTVCADPRAFPRRRIQNAVVIRTSLATEVRPRLLRFARGSLVHPRGALVAEIGEGWAAVSVHLGLRGPERGRHVEQLVSLLEGAPGPFVVGADLNALPGSPGPARLAALATDCWDAVGEGSGATFPSYEPTARIDYLLVAPAIQPLRAWIARSTVSDHLMVVADLRLGR
jgi:endonuclease/exonuclease/phosphatase family metal-dependent hydrolase